METKAQFAAAQRDDHNEWCFASLSDVRNNFEQAGADLSGVRFVAGDVTKTLADKNNLPEAISVLRLDTDFYDSTKVEMEILYPLLSKAGSLLIDDFGHWEGARKAVEEYLDTLPSAERPLLHFTDYTGRMGVKIQMRPKEAAEIARWVKELELPSGAVCLNIGSSTKWFRTEKQPHIHRLLFGPLEETGLRIVHCDMKPEEGVDEIGDVLDPAVQERLRSYNADLLICSNLLEHLTDPHSFASACGSLVKPGGYGLFTVPYKYPYHADPIDMMLRPSPDELAAFLEGWQVVKAVDRPVGSYRAELKAARAPVVGLMKHIGRVLLPFYRPAHWWPMAQRLTYLFRPYRQSMLLARKPDVMR